MSALKSDETLDLPCSPQSSNETNELILHGVIFMDHFSVENTLPNSGERVDDVEI